MSNQRAGAAPGADDQGRAAPQFTDEELAEKIESRRLPPGIHGAFILLLCLVTPFITFAITYDVIVRYVFNDTLLWLNDVTGYLLAALTFLGGAYVMSRDGHTRVDILVTHGPAQGWGDRTPVAGRAGCADLRRRIADLRPRLHLFGHIHTDGGLWTDGATTYVNVTTWECERPPTVIDIDASTLIPVTIPPHGRRDDADLYDASAD